MSPLEDVLHRMVGPMAIAGVLLVAHHVFHSLFADTFVGLIMAHKPEKQLEKAKLQAYYISVRVISSVHHVLIVALSLAILADPAHWRDRMRHTSYASDMMAATVTGFFIFDCVDMFRTMKPDGGPIIFLHGTGSLLVMGYGYLQRWFHFHGAAVMVWEASSPFVHLHWFLCKFGWTKNPVYLINGALLWATFMGCRVVFATYDTVLFMTDLRREAQEIAAGVPDRMPMWVIWMYTILNPSFLLLNWFWAVMINYKIYMTLSGKKAAAKAARKLAAAAAAAPAASPVPTSFPSPSAPRTARGRKALALTASADSKAE